MTNVTNATTAMKTMFRNLQEARPEFVRLQNEMVEEMSKPDRDPRKVLDLVVENAKLAMSITHKSISEISVDEKGEMEDIVNGFKMSQDEELNSLIKEAEEFKEALENKAPAGVNSAAAVQLPMDNGLLAEYMERISVDVSNILSLP